MREAEAWAGNAAALRPRCAKAARRNPTRRVKHHQKLQHPCSLIIPSQINGSTMKSHQKMKRSIQVVNIWNSLCSLNIPNPLCCARIDRCWDSALQPAPSRPGSTSPSCTYLRRETLRVKWQRREDALSPRSRAEGGHQTRRTC